MKKKMDVCINIKIRRVGKYPYCCRFIKFYMIDDGNAYDAVKTLMADMGISPTNYSFYEPNRLGLTIK